MNVISITGNLPVCLVVYKNPKLRSTTNLYINALVVSDLLCATVEMPLISAELIIGKWDFGDALCQFLGFVDSFVSYVTPATMGLMAFKDELLRKDLFTRPNLRYGCVACGFLSHFICL